MRIYLFITCIVWSTVSAYGQYSISGAVRSQADQQPVRFAIVKLMQQADSAEVKTVVADSAGKFLLSVSDARNYLLMVTSLGFHPRYIRLTEQEFGTHPTLALPTILLEVNSIELATVTIKATKPLLERKADRFVVNASQLGLPAGNSIWDVLRQTPLVIAGDQGGLSLVGKSAAMVYINGRKSSLRGEALYAYLKSLPADNIESVELITMPGSSFDAEGNAGVINLVLKKKATDGYQARISTSATQATFMTLRANGSLYYRKGKLATSTTFYYNGIKQLYTDYSTVNFHKLGYENKNDTEREEPKTFYGGNFVLGYDFTPRQNLTIAIDYGLNNQDLVYRTHSTYQNITQTTLDSVLTSESTRSIDGHILSLNANYHVELDSTGRSLDLMVDYFDYLDNFKQQNTTLRTSEPVALRDNHLSTLPQKIGNMSLSLQYVHPMSKRTKLETGGKFFTTSSDNNLYFGTWKGTAYQEDRTRSNHFTYQEQVLAAYASVNHQWNAKWQSAMGLRLENTQIEGLQRRTGEEIANQYTNLFPTLQLSYAHHANHQFSYGFTSRINRPDFWSLNPIRIYQTPTIYVEGNPLLQPTRIWKNEITYTLKQKHIILGNYNRVVSPFSQLIFTRIGSDEIRYQTVNYGHSDEFNLGIVLNESFWHKRISTSFTTIGAFANYAQASQPAIKTSFGRIMLRNTITLSEKRKLTGYANLTMLTSYRSVLGKHMGYWHMDAGVRKLVGKWSIYLFANDLFRSAVQKIYLENQVTNNFYRKYFDQRNIQLSLSYGFGNDKLKKGTRREGSNSEIRNRTNK